MNIQLIPDAITRRRSKNAGLDWLSDWQVHSANITASAIDMLAFGLDEGPLYVPMPTGSGKTTGAIWGIESFARDYPEQRLCFLTPYQSSVSGVPITRFVRSAKAGVHRSGFADAHSRWR